MKTVRIGGVEYILFGDYVAVAQSLRAIRQEINFGGDSHAVWEQVPYGQPYIDFPDIHRIGGEYYLDDDDSISGGLSAEEARQVAAELLAAAAWLEGNS